MMVLLCCGILSKWTCYCIVCIAWVFQITHLFCTWSLTSRANYPAVKERLKRNYYTNSGVSIIKPLNGLIPSLEENLLSYFTLEYPLYELIFCVADKNDPAIGIVKKLQQQFKETSVIISVGTTECGQNPKLRNLSTGYNRAKYDLIWIVDANIIASDCALQDMVDKCVDGARLVHQIPWGVSGPSGASEHQTMGALSFGSMLERWYFATSHGRPYMVVNNLFCSCVSGMSNMISKPHFEKMGGLHLFGNHIAEDSKMGIEFDKEGYKVAISKYTAIQNLSVFDISHYIARRVRWTRLRLQIEKTAWFTPFELVVDSHLLSWMSLISLAMYHQSLSTNIAIVHPFAWLLVDAIVFMLFDRAVGLPSEWQNNQKNNYFFDWGRISDKPRGFYFFLLNMFQHYILWVFREFLGVYIRFKALQNTETVNWGGNDYTINNKGKTKVK